VLDSVGVGCEGEFPTLLRVGVGGGESADEHEKGGLGEVEVGEEAADNAEAVARGEEDAGGAGVGF